MNRTLNNWIRSVLENLIPPVIRDSRWFMYLPMRLIFGRDYRKFMRFKADAVTMTADDLTKVYAELKVSRVMQRPTDLNDACIDRILADVAPYTNVLDVGCGRGYLSGKIAERVKGVVGADVYIDPAVRQTYPNVTFQSSDLEHLDFADRSFDVVTCTHTLEHVKNVGQALAELRRVARSQIIIVVPKERPYRYTLNLHLHFFPYVESFLLAANPPPGQYVCEEVDGDIYYRESQRRT